MVCYELNVHTRIIQYARMNFFNRGVEYMYLVRNTEETVKISCCFNRGGAFVREKAN